MSVQMINVDILSYMCERLTPCEQTFYILRLLASVCKASYQAVARLHGNVAWQRPYLLLCQTYYRGLRTMHNEEAVHKFLEGMKVYTSCKIVQEQIMRTILMPTVKGVAEQERIRAAQIDSVVVENFIPCAFKIVQRFPLSGGILYGFCRLVWGLCKMDFNDNSRERRAAIIACGVVPAMVRGIALHRNMLCHDADYHFVSSLGGLGFHDNSVVSTIVEYIRSEFQSVDIVHSVFMFIITSVSPDNNDYSEYIIDTGVLPIIIKQAALHIRSVDIARVSCLILASFATKHKSARDQIIGGDGVYFVLDVLNAHGTVGCTEHCYKLIEALLLDAGNVVLFLETRVVERVARALLEPTPVALITSSLVLLTFSILRQSMHENNATKNAMMHYEVVALVERVARLHRNNMQVCAVLVLFLGDLCTCDDFKPAEITTELCEILLSICDNAPHETVFMSS